MSKNFTVANAKFSTTAPRGRVTVIVEAIGESTWAVIMDAPSGQPLVAGRYDVARPGQTTGHAFDFVGNGKACFTGSGTLIIDELMQTGGALERLRASFSFSCDGAPPITGKVAVLWNAQRGFH